MNFLQKPKNRRLFFWTVMVIVFFALLNEILIIYWQTNLINYIEVIPKPNLNIFQNRLLNAVNNDFSLMDDVQNFSYNIEPATLKKWLISDYRDFWGQRINVLRESDIKEYVLKMPITIATQPVNGRLAIDNNDKLIESKSSINGLVLNIDKTVANITSALKNGKNWAEISFDELNPKISLKKAKELGIDSLLATGQSNFAGSSIFRVQNITVGSAVYNGIVIKPGQEFSFNNLLGTVDASTGYKSELVVKNHEISSDFGGGLCQVSTTAFRAAVLAGLPITERHNHSLALKYYSPQGFDATIYPGVSDMRFINDTNGNILIQTQIRETELFFEFFGKNDGRKVILDGPKTLSWEVSGAMKTILNRTITYADGMVFKDYFYSEFSPAALYPMAKNPLE
jgi:vancomycin resistance protein YoaR